MEDSLETNQYPVCKSSELLDNAMKKITVNITDILIGRRNGKLFACNNSCPHKGASLSKGDFNGENIVCHMHGYEYNLFTGKLENMKSWKKEDTWIEQDMEWRKSGDLILYKIFEENEIIYVKLN